MSDDSLVAGAAFSFSATVRNAGRFWAHRAPSSAGPYYYGACVDAVTDETNTENNCSQAVEVTVLETQQQQGQTTPDLVVESPSVSDDSLVAGAAFSFSATVRNAGRFWAHRTTLRYYRSPDATITTEDTPRLRFARLSSG